MLIIYIYKKSILYDNLNNNSLRDCDTTIFVFFIFLSKRGTTVILKFFDYDS